MQEAAPAHAPTPQAQPKPTRRIHVSIVAEGGRELLRRTFLSGTTCARVRKLVLAELDLGQSVALLDPVHVGHRIHPNSLVADHVTQSSGVLVLRLGATSGRAGGVDAMPVAPVPMTKPLASSRRAGANARRGGRYSRLPSRKGSAAAVVVRDPFRIALEPPHRRGAFGVTKKGFAAFLAQQRDQDLTGAQADASGGQAAHDLADAYSKLFGAILSLGLQQTLRVMCAASTPEWCAFDLVGNFVPLESKTEPPGAHWHAMELAASAGSYEALQHVLRIARPCRRHPSETGAPGKISEHDRMLRSCLAAALGDGHLHCAAKIAADLGTSVAAYLRQRLRDQESGASYTEKPSFSVLPPPVWFGVQQWTDDRSGPMRDMLLQDVWPGDPDRVDQLMEQYFDNALDAFRPDVAMWGPLNTGRMRRLRIHAAKASDRRAVDAMQAACAEQGIDNTDEWVTVCLELAKQDHLHGLRWVVDTVDGVREALRAKLPRSSIELMFACHTSQDVLDYLAQLAGVQVDGAPSFTDVLAHIDDAWRRDAHLVLGALAQRPGVVVAALGVLDDHQLAARMRTVAWFVDWCCIGGGGGKHDRSAATVLLSPPGQRLLSMSPKTIGMAVPREEGEELEPPADLRRPGNEEAEMEWWRIHGCANVFRINDIARNGNPLTLRALAGWSQRWGVCFSVYSMEDAGAGCSPKDVMALLELPAHMLRDTKSEGNPKLATQRMVQYAALGAARHVNMPVLHALRSYRVQPCWDQLMDMMVATRRYAYHYVQQVHSFMRWFVDARYQGRAGPAHKRRLVRELVQREAELRLMEPHPGLTALMYASSYDDLPPALLRLPWVPLVVA